MKRLFISLVVGAVVVGMLSTAAIRRAEPILRARVEQTLSARFDVRVELDDLQVSVLRGLEVSGRGLRIYPPDDVVASAKSRPLIAIVHFEFRAGVIGLFVRPVHAKSVKVTGMRIEIPPRRERSRASRRGKAQAGGASVSVEEIVCEDSRLILETDDPGKEAKDFELRQVTLRDVGPNASWHYAATLVNAIPRGDIQASGNFGPWETDDPGDSPVSGTYRFDHADLSTIKGIGGILSSTGKFKGS